MRVIPDFKDGQPYFVAKDVAEALGFTDTKQTIQKQCPNRVHATKSQLSKGYDSYPVDIPNRGLNVIPESDVYRLVMRSNLPSAQAFQDWVCGTVLPAIRKDGAYIMGEEKGINWK
ncbi:BRO-N domain-containing protein [Shewanella algae]|uniref:BRO-N domain-containing protein n=1 Tax=Shewanella algae TaxID=38313 RepID=UPI0009F1909E